ncbi:MAG: hypothetical protein UZ20_WS6002000429 [candidate division WS6 bacterium OLB21]|uniref:Uncharacterized protein n=1 Tax=candidate division WS6 bacterium OLB21 TaxID=1617427 RepID=A0A136KJK5_9BACT|nr:MAG: hypothetical protein UZ20_WS6002000429 [candidate division WS6 bacterium OLB21]
MEWRSFRITDDTRLMLGTDDDIQVFYSTSNNRLEYRDGTNLLMALTDAGSTGNLIVSGTVNIGNAANNVLGISAASAATNDLFGEIKGFVCRMERGVIQTLVYGKLFPLILGIILQQLRMIMMLLSVTGLVTIHH